MSRQKRHWFKNTVEILLVVKCYSHVGRVWQFLKKLSVNLYSLTILYLRMSSRRMNVYIHSKTFMWMFIAALFITAKNWKLAKCSSTSEWKNKVWCIHAVEYYSAVKRTKLPVWCILQGGWNMLSWKEADAKDWKLFDSTYMECPEKADL